MKTGEQELVRHCLQGNENAWVDFVRSHSTRIYNLSYRFTRCRSEAEDVTQDVFVRVHQTLNSYRAETGSLSGWLSRVARNLLIDRYRKAHKRRQFLLVQEPVHLMEDCRASNPLQYLVRAEASEVLHKALLQLPPNTRRVVMLHDLDGMALHEIARVLHIPLGTVKSRMIRGRRELAQILRQSSNLWRQR